MNGNRKVICAGCNQKHLLVNTDFYRNKRWCGKSPCKEIIDYKVKHANYKKARKKMEKGTFRHGVQSEMREYIKNRDQYTCQNCKHKHESLMLQVHHIIPVANGGQDEKENLVLLCYECHTNVHKDGWENYTNKFFGYTSKVMA